MAKFSKESLARIAEGERLLEERLAKQEAERAEKAAAEKAKWDFYHEQLAKMPEWKPGSRKSRGSIVHLNNNI